MCNFHLKVYIDLNIDLQLWIFNFEKVSVNMQTAKLRTSFLSCGDNVAIYFFQK